MNLSVAAKKSGLISLSSLQGLVMLALSLILVGCGGDSTGTDASNAMNGTVRWVSFPVTIYADPQITQDTEANDDFRDAMNFWEQKTGLHLFDYRGPWTGPTPYTGDVQDPGEILANVMLLQNPWPYGTDIVGKTHIHTLNGKIQRSLILLDKNLSYCTGDCSQPPSTLSRRKLMAHELGHFIGMDHVNDDNNIMFPSITNGGKLDGLEIDMNAIQRLTN